MLQYTSGSTAAPKGVVLTHRNLLHNLSLIRSAFNVDARRRTTSACSGCRRSTTWGSSAASSSRATSAGASVLMSSATFLQRPLAWLEAMSKYRATTSAAPNFAFDLCVDRITPEETARARSVVLAHGVRRRRADSRGHDRPLCAGVRRPRIPPRGVLPVLRPGGRHAVRVGRTVGSWTVHARRVARRAGAEARRARDGGRSAPARFVRRSDDGQSGAHRRSGYGRPVRGAPRRRDLGERRQRRVRGYWNRPEESRSTFGAAVAGDEDVARPICGPAISVSSTTASSSSPAA